MSAKLRLDQVDRALAGVGPNLPPLPPGGWLKTVREALGMTIRQLAARMGVPHTLVVQAERNEARDRITLAQLRRFAEALDCDLRYVLVPRTPLRDRIEQQAKAVARRQVAPVAHTMALEAQETRDTYTQSQIEDVTADLLRGTWSRLWD